MTQLSFVTFSGVASGITKLASLNHSLSTIRVIEALPTLQRFTDAGYSLRIENGRDQRPDGIILVWQRTRGPIEAANLWAPQHHRRFVL
jgi:hypothetical protein